MFVRSLRAYLLHGVAKDVQCRDADVGGAWRYRGDQYRLVAGLRMVGSARASRGDGCICHFVIAGIAQEWLRRRADDRANGT